MLTQPLTQPEHHHKYDYPIETELQKEFWGSRNDTNHMRAILAFSKVQGTEEETRTRCIINLDRWNHKRHIPALVRQAFYELNKQYVDNPSMAGIPLI